MQRHRTGRFSVYIVECADGTYYTGSTNDVEKRLRFHNAGHGAKYLRGRRPVQLVYTKGYRSYKNALRAEARLKRQTRQFKEALIRLTGDHGARP